MISVIFFRRAGKPAGFKITGHADFAEKGSDIVCAAVSSASFMAANTITEFAGGSSAMKENEILLDLIQSNENAQTVLKGFELHIRELEKQYPKNIEVVYSTAQN